MSGGGRGSPSLLAPPLLHVLPPARPSVHYQDIRTARVVEPSLTTFDNSDGGLLVSSYSTSYLHYVYPAYRRRIVQSYYTYSSIVLPTINLLVVLVYLFIFVCTYVNVYARARAPCSCKIEIFRPWIYSSL